MSRRATIASTTARVPQTLRDKVDQIWALTDGFCNEHLDAEYAELGRRLVTKLARKRPSPLARGDLRIWAAAAIYAVGWVNFLLDPGQRPHLTGDELSRLTGVPKTTMAGKAKVIRDCLKLERLDLEFCRRELAEQHPIAWLVELDGMVVDARWLPPDLQAEARRLGLIPDLSPPGRATGEVA